MCIGMDVVHYSTVTNSQGRFEEKSDIIPNLCYSNNHYEAEWAN